MWALDYKWWNNSNKSFENMSLPSKETLNPRRFKTLTHTYSLDVVKEKKIVH
jgi:hypothetical protein